MKRKPFDSLNAEILGAAGNLKICEANYKSRTSDFGMNDNRRKAQLELWNGYKTIILERLYSVIRDELGKSE